MSTDAGIDYSWGKSNYNKKTGIHFGVIPAGEIPFWYEESEAHYEGPNCPECGNKVYPAKKQIFHCPVCKEYLWEDVCYSDEASEFTYDGDGIIAQQSGDDSDIFVMQSPYYTHAQFCSPCAAGAPYLLDPLEGTDGPRAYCFGHEWFDEGVAPYPVYSVKTGKLIAPKGNK